MGLLRKLAQFALLAVGGFVFYRLFLAFKMLLAKDVHLNLANHINQGKQGVFLRDITEHTDYTREHIIEDGIERTAESDHRARGEGADPEDVRVEDREVDRDRLPVEAGREVAEAIGDFLPHAQFFEWGGRHGVGVGESGNRQRGDDKQGG